MPLPELNRWTTTLPDTSKRHRGNEGDCLHAPWSLPWCPWNAAVEIYNFLYRVPCTKEKLPWCLCPFKNEAYSPARHTTCREFLPLFPFLKKTCVSHRKGKGYKIHYQCGINFSEKMKKKIKQIIIFQFCFAGWVLSAHVPWLALQKVPIAMEKVGNSRRTQENSHNRRS